MNKIQTLLASATIGITVYASTAHAGWGDLLNDLGSFGKSLLSDESQATDEKSSASLDYSTVVSGLKQALEIGSRRAIDNVSQLNGFLDNKLIRIPLPPEVQQTGKLMRQFGLSSLADQFEQSMNHAAEKAAPQATQIIVDAIKKMSFDDARKILYGPDNAATDYFKTNTTEKLTSLFRPIIENSLNQVGTTRYYNDLSAQVAAIPLVGENIQMDLPGYVTSKALDGMFTMIAKEEKQIRDNPTARTTDLLKQVFGSI